MKVRKINGHEFAQVKVYEYDNGAVTLVSYTTAVIGINPEGWLEVSGLYSRTTIKHIGWFMRELGFTYQLAKQLYMDNKRFNIYTGEIEDRG
jgi:hypothetical protein